MLETPFRTRVLEELESSYPGLFIIKPDSSFIQGIPDRFLFYRDRWVALEFKRSRSASLRANQEYYVKLLREMGGYASFVNPDNVNEVMYEIRRSFSS